MEICVCARNWWFGDAMTRFSGGWKNHSSNQGYVSAKVKCSKICVFPMLEHPRVISCVCCQSAVHFGDGQFWIILADSGTSGSLEHIGTPTSNIIQSLCFKRISKYGSILDPKIDSGRPKDDRLGESVAIIGPKSSTTIRALTQPSQ